MVPCGVCVFFFLPLFLQITIPRCPISPFPQGVTSNPLVHHSRAPTCLPAPPPSGAAAFTLSVKGKDGGAIPLLGGRGTFAKRKVLPIDFGSPFSAQIAL